MDRYWILDENKQAVPADMEAWGRFFEVAQNRRVAFDEPAPGVRISTVFLDLDHRIFGGSGRRP